MSTAGEEIGSWLVLAAVIGGIWYATTHYEIRAKEDEKPQPVKILTPSLPPRPHGMIQVSSTDEGTVWLLDADSVRGPRQKRLGWLVMDHQKDKTMGARSTNEFTQVNCDTTESKVLRAIRYNADGKSGDTWGKGEKEEANYYPPNSRGGQVVAAICKPEFGP